MNLRERKRAAFNSVYAVLLSFLLLFIINPLSAFAQEDEASPKAGKHLYKHYCAVCHGFTGKGNGPNADNLGDVHPTDLTSEAVDKLEDEEIYEVIEGGGAAIDISYYMPPWGSILSSEQINDIVAYIRTLSEANGREISDVVRFADVRREGDDKCLMCHSQEQNLLRPIAPNIGHEGSKLRKEWLRGFLKEPELLRPVGFMPFSKSKMPNFYFTDAEVDALVAYLMTLKDEGIDPNILAGWDAGDPAEIEKGKIYFVEDYACDGCHKRSSDGDGGTVGPELSSAVERIRPEWMFYWLKNPQRMRPDTPMPNFDIPDEKIRSLLSYLYGSGGNAAMARAVSMDEPLDEKQLEKGKKIVESKNCQGCHLIDSYNSQSGPLRDE